MAVGMTISNVPAVWAMNQPVTREDRLAIALLRQAGCTCEFPLLRNARDEDWNANDGPRCKVCNANVVLVPPTTEETLAYKRRSHQTFLWYDRNHPGAFESVGWKSECFAGCGCDDRISPLLLRRIQQDQAEDRQQHHDEGDQLPAVEPAFRPLPNGT